MADLCIPFNTDSEIIALRATFETSFREFNEVLGDDCSVFSTVSDLFKDAANVANQWEKELKGAIKDVLAEASKIFEAIKNFVGGITQPMFDLIKQALTAANAAFTNIMIAVGEMMSAIGEAVNAIKMMTCDLISDGIKLIPAEIVAGAVAVAAVKGYNFAKDINGKNIVGSLDVYNMSTEVLKTAGIVGMKDAVINSAADVINIGLPADLSSFACTPII